MKVKFISLASGSSGNCYYIGTEKYGILIDAGIAVRTIKKSLKEVGVGMETIRAGIPSTRPRRPYQSCRRTG